MNDPPWQNPHRPLVLMELFALPGSGKSTVADAVAGRAAVTTRKALSAKWARGTALDQIGHIARAFNDHSRLARAMRFAVGARIANPESIFRLFRLLAKPRWLASQSGVMLLDQGFLQELWSILVSGRSDRSDPELLAPLIAALYKGIDVRIIALKIDTETVAGRIRDRTEGDSRFDGLPEEELLTALAFARRIQDQIFTAAKLAGLDVQTVDGTLAPALLADQLLSLLPDSERQKDRVGRQRMRRISVVGSTGSGKTYFANELSARLGLPTYALDNVRETVRESSSNNMFPKVVAELARRDEWIIDGHYRDVRQLIWSRADLIIWLNYPMHVVATRLLSRFLQKRRYLVERGYADSPRARPVPAASWSWRFRRIARTLRERREYARMLRAPESGDLRVVELASSRMARQWLQSLSSAAPGVTGSGAKTR